MPLILLQKFLSKSPEIPHTAYTRATILVPISTRDGCFTAAGLLHLTKGR
jgi:hypothetical protein